MNNRNILLCVIILVLVLLLVCLRKKENFGEQLTYKINAENSEKKAITYNISRFRTLENNLGNALQFERNSRLEVNDVYYSSYTVSFIVIITNLSNDYTIFTSNNNVNNHFLEIALKNKQIRLTYGLKNDNQKIFSRASIKLSQLNHVAITNEGGKVNLFVNGKMDESPQLNYELSIKDITFGMVSTRQYFEGYIGQINIFSKKMTQSELCNLHNLCTEEEDTGPVISNTNLQSTRQNIPVQSCKDTCNFIAQGNTELECIRKCQLYEGCDSVKCADICHNCKNEDFCKWLIKEDPICKFVPYGRDKFSCIETCILSKDCDYLNCQRICDNCNDSTTCPWVQSSQDEREFNIYNEDPDEKIDATGKPSAPHIQITPKYKSVLISIDRPHQGNSPIGSYIIFLYKTFNKGEGVTISQLKNEATISQFIFDELDPYETYSVGVRAKNNEGLSHISNIESFKPNTKKMKLPELVLEEPNNNVEPPKDRNYQFCNK